MSEKFEKKKKFEDEKELNPTEAKIKRIMDSKMPEAQKQACLRELMPKGKAKMEGMPFNVYARIKKIPKTKHKAMQSYPKAKNVSLATIEKWDEIFTDF